MIELLARPAWTAEGLCVGVETERFFPARGETLPEPIAQACRACHVRAECLLAALVDPGERHGVWGGLAERSRRMLRRTGVYRSRFDVVVFDREAVAVTFTARQPVVSIAEAVEGLEPFRAEVFAATG